ncbi:MAG: HAD-IA family hydrolase [Pseudomonadota bacterium]
MARAALLVDLDGTLVDTAPDMVAALARVCVSHGQPIPDLAAASRRVSDGSMALLRAAFGDVADTERDLLLPEFLNEYTQHVADNSVLFDGWSSVLDWLEHRQLPWGIVTNKPEAISRRLLRLLELDVPHDCIIGGDTLTVRKPDPMPLLHAAERLTVTPSQCIYIGDHQRDIDAGRAAGMATVAARWGYLKEGDSTEAWQADWIATKPTDLLEFLTDRWAA